MGCATLSGSGKGYCIVCRLKVTKQGSMCCPAELFFMCSTPTFDIEPLKTLESLKFSVFKGFTTRVFILVLCSCHSLLCRYFLFLCSHLIEYLFAVAACWSATLSYTPIPITQFLYHIRFYYAPLFPIPYPWKQRSQNRLHFQQINVFWEQFSAFLGSHAMCTKFRCCKHCCLSTFDCSCCNKCIRIQIQIRWLFLIRLELLCIYQS